MNVARILIGLSLVVSTVAAAPAVFQDREGALEAFIEEMTQKHGFDGAELARAFRTTRTQAEIVKLMDRAAEPRPWDEYRSRFVTAEKIEAGARYWRENVRALELARQRYGVPEEIVTAVIGIETHYGKHRGRFKVLEALATLAFDYPRRAPEFRLELEHFLLLSREESMALGSPVGSYAGAMGIAQFMPGSYRRYAVDFDDDGRRDLFANDSDAIGSVANYLTAHGWQRDSPVAAPAEVTEAGVEPFRAPRLSARYRLEELRSLGVTANGAHPGSRTAIPLTLNNRAGREYWLGFDNFYVITRYNQSVYYAMAVFQLSEELRAHAAARAAGDR